MRLRRGAGFPEREPRVPCGSTDYLDRFRPLLLLVRVVFREVGLPSQLRSP